MRYLLSRSGTKGRVLVNRLGGDEASRLLSHKIGHVKGTTYGTAIRLKKHGIDVETRYVDDGDDYIRRLSDGEDLSKGQLGEKAAYQLVKENDDYEILTDIDKIDVHQPGIDLIARDTKTGDIVIIEAKFSSRTGNIGKGYLPETKTKGRQMSDEWILKSVRDMRRKEYY
ncbi:hypothetical protein ACFQH6_11890 [Halobacteriaceae archaeon GCM10025711]